MFCFQQQKRKSKSVNMKYLFIFLSLFILQLSSSQNDSVFNIGKALVYKNKLDQAITHYNTYLIKPKSSEEKIKLLLALADVYKLKLDYNKTNSYLTKANNEISKTDNKQLKFLYHVKMIEFYRKRGLYIEAIKHQEIGEALRKENTINEAYLASYYGRRASLFSQHFGIEDSIIKYAKKSLTLAEKLEDKDNVFYSKLEIASVYDRRKEYKKALVYFEELIEYAKQNNLIQHQADVYINYTNALISDNQLEKALAESLVALDFAKENNLLYNEITIAINVYETYKKLGNHLKAYDYLLYRIILTEKYNVKQHDKYLFELEERYKLSEKENQIKIKTLEIDNKNKALASNKTNLFISIGLLLIAIITTVLIAYFLKKSKENNKKLQSLSKENEFLLNEANHRINNNLQLVIILISDQLKLSDKSESFEIKNILTKVKAIATLHKHLYKNEDKKKIDLHNYLSDVMVSFFAVFKENEIKTKFSIVSIEVPTDYAMYFGLLLTELAINSVKHAFINQENKEISFNLLHKDNGLYFDYFDNGNTALNKTLKPKLIDKLCRQLDVNYNINTSNGFNFSFKIIIKDD